MNLTEAQTREIFDRTGSFVREVCDACGRALGAVRYTIRGDGRAWCSAECRDPHLPAGWRSSKPAPSDPCPSPEMKLSFQYPEKCLACGAELVGRRAGSEFCDRACKQRFRRRHSRKS